MKRSFLFLFVLLFTLPVFAFSTTATGGDLLEYCKIAMDIHDRQYGKPQTEPEYILGAKTGICEGYLMSAKEMQLQFVTDCRYTKNQRRCASFCLPPTYNLLIGASVIVKYLKDHKEQQDLPASLLVNRALATYFPC